ncbi:DUF1772 domain-containing protein [Kineococcus gypseus]|uniref:anthrone oxygenase family protein n=1 Tax=Kineococcus gypseus TaxID=1637102 RepID=UPI003D7E5630
MRVLTLLAGTGCLLVGGVFFAFSGFVLPALARLPGERGAEAMRSVNALAVRAPLLVALFATAAACAALGVLAVRQAQPLAVAGCGAYLLGVLAVTALVHVPLNERLAAAGVPFERYVARWGRWNHVRTCASVCAGVLVLV